ncbi:AmmeMemoRadiSam system radical SAM enzyme [Desulfovibrio mangrovi]|uniref:AmmeMemoRadiSam system radical SAM enzyme n=1 Tax=Desulfovibrio mangrovi TaxID=2976983 RepID=UPI0022482708|nr:AmmeMemoRadiSam system radical SAM enzyme [Desulfovibrio mangrovi]UZP68142.1 AmmeMemoRadiSam system radical SAM enzyme [Desulfovibrio mangrovi]
MHPARHWKTLKDDTVQCRLCAHACVIKAGAVGRCGVRHNMEGALFTATYDRIAAANLDPVEKKPLYHFLPSTTTFSFGTMGCNLRCSFCQNYSLSDPPHHGVPVQGQLVTPEVLVDEALRLNAQSISYTYSEPTIFYELMADTASRAIEHGLMNVMVSNGFQSKECLDSLNGLIHACNIDLKAFTEEFYETHCGAKLKPVLRNLKHIVSMGWWLEVTTLLIPGANDSDAELNDIACFIRDELGKHVPWHISRFHPTHRMLDRPPTPLERLERAWEIGKQCGLEYVYLGNVHGHPSEHTACPSCGKIVIRRTGYRTLFKGAHVCQTCGTSIPGIWSLTP